MRISLRLAFVLVTVLWLTPTRSMAWERSLPPIGGVSGVYAITFDPAGDVVVAGGGFSGGTTPGFVSKLSGVDGIELWRRDVAGTAGGGFMSGVLADGGDIFVVGHVRNLGTHDDFVAVKLSGADGAELWRQEIDGSATTEPGSGDYQHDRGVGVAVGPDGDPIFAGNLYHWQESTNVLVVKLARASGAELWRKEVDGGAGAADHLEEFEAFTLAPNGDPVFTAGMTAGGGEDLTVVRLAALDGAELWRYVSGAVRGVYGIALTIDQTGDILATGSLEAFGGGVVKVDGTSGGEIWRYGWGSPSNGYGVCLATDANGDVLVGAVDAGFAVMKLAGSDGTLLWRYVTVGSFPWEIGLDPAGNVIAVGGLDANGQSQFGIVGLAGTTGAERWRYESAEQGRGEARGSFVDAAGRTVAGGWSSDASASTGLRGFVVKVAPEVAGKVLAVGDSAAAPSKRTLKLRSQQRGIVVATLGGPADPTVAGGALEIYNPLTGEIATMSLPAAQWQAVRGSRGLSYRFKGGKADTCQKVSAGDGKIDVSCKGAGVGFSLDEATQGALGVRLTLGAAPGVGYCAVFGGTIARDTGTLGVGKGTFKAKSAPAPASCAVP